MPRARSPKATLFLGAGASRAFDYSTTLDFVTRLTGVVTEEDKEILNSILASPGVSDIEHVLRTLDSIIDFNSIQFIKTLFEQSNVTTRKGELQ